MPVFSAHLATGYQSLGVNHRIAEERQARNLTLRELGKIVGLSAAQLSNIETGKAKLNLTQLVRIADGLKVPVTTLLPRSTAFPFYIARRESIASSQPQAITPVAADGKERASHNRSIPLAEQFVGKHMVPVLAEIHVLEDSNLQLIGHHHEEFFFVLRGEVETQIKTNSGFVVETLGPGDCLYLRSYLPHCHRSMTAEPAQALSVSCSLRRPVEPEDDEFGEPSGTSFYQRTYRADAMKEVAEKMALLRRSRRLSVEKLAHAVGISPRQLAAIERGSKPIELDVLLKVASEFKRPLEYFLRETLESGPSHIVTRRDAVPNIRSSVRKTPPGTFHLYKQLAAEFPDRGLHPYYVQLKEHTHEGLEHHPGQEFGYVLEGEAELIVETPNGREANLLMRGDAYFLDANARHRLCAYSQNPYSRRGAELLIVFWTPTGEQSLFEGSTMA